MTESVREIIESPWEQGAEEVRPYALTVTPWGSTPSAVVVKLYEGRDLTDRSTTMLTGAASVNGNEITTPAVTGLTPGLTYRLEIKFTIAGRVEEAYAEILAKR